MFMKVVALTVPRRMSISDVHFLIARARLEADNPAFKVSCVAPRTIGPVN